MEVGGGNSSMKGVLPMKQLSEHELVPSTYLAEVRLLYRVAMLVFVVTVGIGLLNGLDWTGAAACGTCSHVQASLRRPS